MAHPTSNGLMNACEEAIKKEKIEYQRNGTYVVMEGPQFSTLAESNLYRSWKADVIGMTNMPEAKLAREAEIRYASVSMVTDYDCWHPDHENVDVQQVIKVLLGNAAKAKNMIKNLIDNFEKHIDPKDPANNCLDVAIITAPEKRTQKTHYKMERRRDTTSDESDATPYYSTASDESDEDYKTFVSPQARFDQMMKMLIRPK